VPKAAREERLRKARACGGEHVQFTKPRPVMPCFLAFHRAAHEARYARPACTLNTASHNGWQSGVT
jgi:hypothetical protein